MVWLVHTQKLKCILRNFRCEGKLIKTECSKRALTEISSKPNIKRKPCHAGYASEDIIFLIFGWVKFHVFLWMVFNQQLQLQKRWKNAVMIIIFIVTGVRKLHACTHRPRPSPRPILPRTHAHTCTAKGWATAHVIQLISCSGTCASFADSGPLYNLKGKNTHGMFCRTFKEYFAGCCDELHFPYNLFLNRYLTVTSTSTWNRTTPCVKLTLEVRHNPTVYTLLGG